MQARWTAISLAMVTAMGCAASEEGGGSVPLEPKEVEPALVEVARLEQAKDRGGRLQVLLADDDVEVRLAAVRALAHIRHADDAQALAGRFDDSDQRVIRAALFASGLLKTDKDRAPSAPLLPLLQHADSGVRADAVEALGRIGDHTRLEQVLALIRDKDPLVRGEAALAIWRIKLAAPKVEVPAEDPEGEPTIDPVAEEIQKRVHAAVMPVARKSGNEPDAGARWKMLWTVAQLRNRRSRGGPPPTELSENDDAELRTLIRQRLDDGNATVRAYAVQAAGRIWGADAGPVLVPVLQDADWQVRTWAVMGLGKSEAPATAEAIRAIAASDPNVQARRRALEAIAKRKDAGAEELIATALEAKSATVRRAAMGAWAAIKGAAALPALERALRSSEPWSRASAIEAIGATLKQDKPAEGEEAPPIDAGHLAAVVRILQQRMTDGDDFDKSAVMAACESIPVKAACDLLEQGCRVDVLEVRGSACAVIKERAEAINEAGRDLVSALNAAWKDSQDASEYELRQTIIQAWVALGKKRVIPTIEKALAEDVHVAVRKIAAEGLKELGVENVTIPEVAAGRKPGAPDAVVAVSSKLPSRIRIETSVGNMVVELFTELAPVHSLNIITLARQGIYDDLIFHRVVPSFVIQGGDPRRTGWGDPGYTIPNEVNRNRYVKGTLGMPDSGLDTGGCQIFINHLPTPHLDGRYTTFGQVVEGLDVIDKVEVGTAILKITVLDTP